MRQAAVLIARAAGGRGKSKYRHPAAFVTTKVCACSTCIRTTFSSLTRSPGCITPLPAGHFYVASARYARLPVIRWRCPIQLGIAAAARIHARAQFRIDGGGSSVTLSGMVSCNFCFESEEPDVLCVVERGQSRLYARLTGLLWPVAGEGLVGVGSRGVWRGQPVLSVVESHRAACVRWLRGGRGRGRGDVEYPARLSMYLKASQTGLM